MGRDRNLKDPSPPTIQRWLEIYGKLLDKAIQDGRLLREPGEKACRHVALAVQALMESKSQAQAARRADERGKTETFISKYGVGVGPKSEMVNAGAPLMSLEEEILWYFEEWGPDVDHSVQAFADGLEKPYDEVLSAARASERVVVKKRNGERWLFLP